MNNKGQTLILFVILVPIFILLLAFVVDTGLILKEHTKLNNTIKSVLKTTYEIRLDSDYQEKVTNLIDKNNIPTLNLKIEVIDNSIKIQNEYQKESIFGKIIGIKEYKIKSVLKIKNENGTLVIEKE